MFRRCPSRCAPLWNGTSRWSSWRAISAPGPSRWCGCPTAARSGRAGSGRARDAASDGHAEQSRAFPCQSAPRGQESFAVDRTPSAFAGTDYSRESPTLHRSFARPAPSGQDVHDLLVARRQNRRGEPIRPARHHRTGHRRCDLHRPLAGHHDWRHLHRSDDTTSRPWPAPKAHPVCHARTSLSFWADTRMTGRPKSGNNHSAKVLTHDMHCTVQFNIQRSPRPRSRPRLGRAPGRRRAPPPPRKDDDVRHPVRP